MLKIEWEVGTRSSQRRTGTGRGSLAALSTKPASGKVMLVAEIVIEFDYAVVAVTERRIGGEIVSRSRGQVIDQAGPKVLHECRRNRIRTIVKGSARARFS